jgi:hypothetical protein
MIMAEFRFLDVLKRETPPLVHGREPYWRPVAAPVSARVTEPAWSYRREVTPHVDGPLRPRDHVVTIDATAAYVSAISTVEVAHGPLRTTGLREYDSRHVGLWRIETPTWNDARLFSPLGTAHHPSTITVTTPTMRLLAQVADQGYMSLPKIVDSWTSTTSCRLRAWSVRIAAARRAALVDPSYAGEYEDVKTAYSQAVVLLGVKDKSPIYRPDWAQFIRAQHAANMWRKMWACTLTCGPILGAGTVDEISITRRTMGIMDDMRERGMRPPIMIESHTTDRLGTFTVKRECTARGWTA